MSKPFRVLVLCTGNSARSILAEALINHHGGGRYRAFSAGSHPTKKVNPWALETLRRHGMEIAEARSKSWDEFAAPGAEPIDLVITVCDAAAGESCPIWPGTPLRVHWGLPDPAAVQGTDAAREAAFEETYRRLEARVRRLADLDPGTLDRESFKRRLQQIHMEAP